MKKTSKIFPFLAGMLVMALLMLSACSNAPAASDAPTDSTEPETSSASAEDEPETYALGDTVTLNDFEITVDSWEATKKIASSAYTSFNSDEGSTYIVVTLSIKNVGTSASTLISTYSIGRDAATAKIYYQGEYEYTGTNLLGYSEDLHDDQLNPLESKTGVLAFSLPDEAAESSDLTFVLSAGKTSYTFALS